MFLGKIDPKTGEVTQYPIPVTKPGFPLGTLDLEVDKDDNPWVGMMYQSAIAKFDPQDRQVRDLVDAQGVGQRRRRSSGISAVEGTRRRRQGVGQELGPAATSTGSISPAGKFEDIRIRSRIRAPAGRIGIYDITADAQNNLYFTRFLRRQYRAHRRQDRRDRRYSDADAELASAARLDRRRRTGCGSPNIAATRIGMFDTKTGQDSRNGRCRRRGRRPMTCVADRNGKAWTGSMTTDRVARLDTKTGQYAVNIRCRATTNIRRVFVDDSEQRRHASGSAATTAPRSSRSSRWIDRACYRRARPGNPCGMCSPD